MVKDLLFYGGLLCLIGHIWWGIIPMLAGCILQEINKGEK